MAKVKGIKAAERKYIKLIRDRLNNDELLTGIAKLAVKRIKGKTRTGTSMVDDDTIKSLEQSTINQRKRLAKNNRVHSTFSASRSNLTLTGQLLNAVTYKVIKGKRTIEIFVKNNLRRPYKGVSGKKYKSVITNKKVAGYVAEGGRPFLGIDDETKRLIIIRVKRFLRRSLR